MNAANDNAARKGLRLVGDAPPRPGMQRLINPCRVLVAVHASVRCWSSDDHISFDRRSFTCATGCRLARPVTLDDEPAIWKFLAGLSVDSRGFGFSGGDRLRAEARRRRRPVMT